MNLDYPLSGDVSQFFKFWAKYMSQQTGIVNINNIASGDPETEKKIIEEVAGYGRQLGRIMDVLKVVVQKLDLNKLPADLSEEDRKIIVRFARPSRQHREDQGGKNKGGIQESCLRY